MIQPVLVAWSLELPLSPTTWATNFGSHQLCPNLSTAGWKIKVRDHNSLSSQLENQGDPSYFKSPSSQSLSYWNCVYFLMVTMSTVGYGDIVCVTAMGRGFQVLFLLVGLVSIYRKQTKTILRREGLFMQRIILETKWLKIWIFVDGSEYNRQA